MNAITKAKMAISRISETRDLHDLRRYINERVRLIGKRQYEAALVEARARMRTLQAGMRVWCCAEGTFIGGPFQRGDEFEVIRSMGHRVRYLWVKLLRTGKSYSMPIREFHWYNLRPEKPENPVDP